MVEICETDVDGFSCPCESHLRCFLDFYEVQKQASKTPCPEAKYLYSWTTPIT